MMYKAIDHVQNMNPEEYAHKVWFLDLSEFFTLKSLHVVAADSFVAKSQDRNCAKF